MMSTPLLSGVPLNMTVPISRKVRFCVEFNGQFYPATSVGHVCAVLDELGVEFNGNLLWMLYRHLKGKSGAGRILLHEYESLRFHKMS